MNRAPPAGPEDAARVSVVIPTYNRAGYLPAALDSVFAQTRPPWEVIVVDDGSTDDTHEALRPYASRIRLLRQDNAGEPVARNRGLAAASGEYVAFLDSDDLWNPALLEAGLEEFRAHPDAGLVTFRRAEIDSRGAPTGHEAGKASPGPLFTTKTLLREDWRKVGMPLVRRRHLEVVGPFNEALRVCPDMEMWLRFSLRFPMREVPRPLYLWRKHEGITNTLRLRLWDIRALDGFAEIMAAEKDPFLRWQCRQLRARLRRRLVRDWLRRDPVADDAGITRRDAIRASREAVRLNPLSVANYLLLGRARLS